MNNVKWLVLDGEEFLEFPYNKLMLASQVAFLVGSKVVCVLDSATPYARALVKLSGGWETVTDATEVEAGGSN